MDFDSTEFDLARELGVERIELYTEPYAKAFGCHGWYSTRAADAPIAHEMHGRSTDRGTQEMTSKFAEAARRASELGLEINAGHDLNLENLAALIRAAPMIAEVSIGHALIADALEFGMANAIQKYLNVIREATK